MEIKMVQRVLSQSFLTPLFVPTSPMNVSQIVLQKKEKYKQLKQKFKSLQGKYKNELKVKTQYEESLKELQNVKNQQQQDLQQLREELNEKNQKLNQLEQTVTQLSQRPIENKQIVPQETEKQKNPIENDKETNKYKKIIEIQKEQILSLIGELRNHSEISLQLRDTIVKQDALIQEIQKDFRQKYEDYEKLNILKDQYFKRQQQLEEEKNQLSTEIDSYKQKMMNSSFKCYSYEAQLVTSGFSKRILVILREKLKGNKVMELEDEFGESLTIDQSQVTSLKKDANQSILIEQNSLMNKRIHLKFNDRDLFYQDLKKFWKNSEETQKNEKGDFIKDLKTFFFNQISFSKQQMDPKFTSLQIGSQQMILQNDCLYSAEEYFGCLENHNSGRNINKDLCHLERAKWTNLCPKSFRYQNVFYWRLKQEKKYSIENFRKADNPLVPEQLILYSVCSQGQKSLFFSSFFQSHFPYYINTFFLLDFSMNSEIYLSSYRRYFLS